MIYKDYLIQSSQEQTAEGAREVWTATHVHYNTLIKAFSEEKLKKIIDEELEKKLLARKKVDEAVKKGQDIIQKLDVNERLKDKDPETKVKTNEQLRQKYSKVTEKKRAEAQNRRAGRIQARKSNPEWETYK